mgnify:CR=1 FL=1
MLVGKHAQPHRLAAGHRAKRRQRITRPAAALALKRLLQLRLRKNDLSVFHVLDRAEIEFPFEDNTLFLSMEDDRSQQANPREIRDSYLEEMKAFIDGARERCNEQDSDYELVRTDEPLDKVLLRYLARRERGR